jgi:hypothetical protein
MLGDPSQKIGYIQEMKFSILLILLLTNYVSLPAQDKDTSRIARVLSVDQLLAPLRYLASDQLRGRHIGLPEIDTAARYIADQFKMAGAKHLASANGYFQIFRSVISRMSPIFQYNPQLAANLPLGSASNGLILKNVVAFVRGTDPGLRDQFIVLSSHYDHLGVTSPAVMEDGKMDSIYNGARDNATGTAAVIDAARYFARYPPKRSVLFICYTAEEEGLIGSEYYARHPLIPLDHTVYNLNVDNASYNTTHAVCLFGLNRTTEDSLINKASMAYGLALLDEPADEDLFARSDNASLAQRGIPAPTYSMGITVWNEKITNRYHRLSDEVANMDMEYVVRFIRAYILAAQYIANDPDQPRWAKGDPNEKEWQILFEQNE